MRKKDTTGSGKKKKKKLKLFMDMTDAVTHFADIKQEILNLFEQHSDALNAFSGDEINHFREHALEDFTRLGIPTKKNEAYKYTPVDAFLEGGYDLEITANPFKIDLDEIFKCNIPELDTDVVLTLNGFFYGTGGSFVLPKGVVVCSLKEASVTYPGLFRRHYSAYADTSVDGLVAMNTLFTQDGVFVYVPEGVEFSRPLQIINLSHSFRSLRITRRNLVVAGKNARAGIVICDHTLCERGFTINALTEVYLDKGARIDYTRIQNENNRTAQINNHFIHQMEQSQFNGHFIALHSGLSRNNFYVSLNEKESDCNLNGLFLCDGKQHVANFVLMRHNSPHCTSNQLFKGILDDRSTGTFNGKILVAKDAQKTQAYQRNNNILLSNTARMNSKPHLEIYADDVKCSHGATTGQLDNEALFYLRSRGISEKEARHLLMYAFANEVVSGIRVDALKDRIIDLIDKRLRGELSKCNDCDIQCG